MLWLRFSFSVPLLYQQTAPNSFEHSLASLLNAGLDRARQVDLPAMETDALLEKGRKSLGSALSVPTAKVHVPRRCMYRFSLRYTQRLRNSGAKIHSYRSVGNRASPFFLVGQRKTFPHIVHPTPWPILALLPHLLTHLARPSPLLRSASSTW